MRIASGESSGAPLLLRPCAQPLGRHLVGDLQEDHGSERLADLVEHRVERLGLGHRAWEAVEHEAVLLEQAGADEVHHELVGDEVAALEDGATRAPISVPSEMAARRMSPVATCGTA